MKYEKSDVERIMTDEEDVVRTSPLEVVGDDDDKQWSGFF